MSNSNLSAAIEQNGLLCAFAYNLVWDSDVNIENDFRSYLLGKPIYDMKCNRCLAFIGAYHTAEECKDVFCHNCGNEIKVLNKDFYCDEKYKTGYLCEDGQCERCAKLDALNCA